MPQAISAAASQDSTCVLSPSRSSWKFQLSSKNALMDLFLALMRLFLLSSLMSMLSRSSSLSVSHHRANSSREMNPLASSSMEAYRLSASLELMLSMARARRNSSGSSSPLPSTSHMFHSDIRSASSFAFAVSVSSFLVFSWIARRPSKPSSDALGYASIKSAFQVRDSCPTLGAISAMFIRTGLSSPTASKLFLMLTQSSSSISPFALSFFSRYASRAFCFISSGSIVPSPLRSSSSKYDLK
mmetsp:Transcript_14199/g.30386  ORF Transcript_14199/g.30386 Transcript_14199/m.30386 type:complete len:243 (-) Transcript_14199:1173-1901(-)